MGTNLKVRGDERRTRERERERERERAMANENLWKDAEHQLKELDLDLEDDGGNNQWDAAATQEVTEDSHWEYWMRKNANEGKGDAVFNGLEYKPVSVMMPVPETDDAPYWGWFKKGTGVTKS